MEARCLHAAAAKQQRFVVVEQKVLPALPERAPGRLDHIVAVVAEKDRGVTFPVVEIELFGKRIIIRLPAGLPLGFFMPDSIAVWPVIIHEVRGMRRLFTDLLTPECQC